MSSGFYRIRPDACPTLYRLWLIDDIDIPTLMPMRLNFIYFFSMKFVLYLVCSHFYWIFRGHQLIYFIYHKLTPYPAGNLEHWACNLEQWASTLRVLLRGLSWFYWMAGLKWILNTTLKSATFFWQDPHPVTFVACQVLLAVVIVIVKSGYFI